MEPKKISFGFSKISKKQNIVPINDVARPVTKVELIKCLEGQEIKLVDEKPEEEPLVIPLKESQKTSTAIASLLKRRAVLLGNDEPEETNANSTETSMLLNNIETEDIEKRAARELLAEIQENASSKLENNLVLPIVKPDDLPLEGAIESTLDDYDNIPVQDFGKAMLRGMGWTDPLPKSNKKVGPPPDDTPMVRPKGMGLGADKSLNKKPLLVAPEANEVLEIKRNALVRILGGKYKDLYGQIEGFDDHAGRVIVKLAIGGAKEAFNEFLCQPISRKEYAQYAKCINSSKYNEYKKKENEYGQIKIDKDDKDLMTKSEKKFSANDKNKNEHKTVEKYEQYKAENECKHEKDRIRQKGENRNRTDYQYEQKTRNKKEETYRNTDRAHIDEYRYYGRKYDGRTPRRDNHRDDERYYRGEDEKYRKSRSCESSAKRSENKQTKYDRSQNEAINDSSDSESDFYSSKHKKSHSKKAKKSKSKRKTSTSDTESTESSSDSEQERTKKHKKKTKKSRKQRERSRSRRRK